MGIFSRFKNAITGAAAEAGDAVMDTEVMANAEVRGATEKMKSDLEKAKVNEAKLGGSVKSAKRELAEAKTLMTQNESAALKAAEAGDMAKAEDFALEAEGLAEQVAAKEQVLSQFENALATQKRNIAKIRENLKLVERETKVLESQRAVNQAKKAASSSLTAVSGEDSDNALAVLRKRKAAEQAKADQLDYVEEQQEEAGKSQDAAAYLKQSGDGMSALERLKAKKG